MPGATRYTLTVFLVTPDVRNATQSTLITAATSLRIPASVFQTGALSSGAFFELLLEAEATPSDYRAGHLGLVGLPAQQTTIASGRFRTTASCGNGVVEGLEEECDTTGETATCNIDCTLSVCGDGLVNAAAGEACDSGGDTTGCDSDCTLPACGDGHLNRALEDCDDGNTVDDGNGCSPDCKLNNVCGNGVVELAAEECDPGPAAETAACNANCAISICGDGVLNRAAGEQCDDGGRNGVGSCSTTCRLQ